jgi:hypothetical protein
MGPPESLSYVNKTAYLDLSFADKSATPEVTRFYLFFFLLP